jgi:hypothetical protein
MRRAVGEGVEPSRSGYSVAGVSHFSSPPRQGGVSAINFTILHYYVLIQMLKTKLLGKGSNLHEVVIPFAGSFPNSSPPGQGGVSAENFTTQQCVFLR